MKVRDLIAALEAQACPEADVVFWPDGGEPAPIMGGHFIDPSPAAAGRLVLTDNSFKNEGGF